jgi:hypothetical protein
MNLPAQRQSGRLPKRFPVGTTYVVEGRGGENGQLRVYSRYVVLPGGQRINVTGNFGASAPARSRRSRLEVKSRVQDRSGTRNRRAKKISGGGGTTRQQRR